MCCVQEILFTVCMVFVCWVQLQYVLFTVSMVSCALCAGCFAYCFHTVLSAVCAGCSVCCVQGPIHTVCRMLCVCVQGIQRALQTDFCSCKFLKACSVFSSRCSSDCELLTFDVVTFFFQNSLSLSGFCFFNV